MQKLFVFMIDALCSSDIEKMKEMPNFKTIIDKGSYIKHIYPPHPALTYCCHTSIVTGCYVDKHGIYNNEYIKRGIGKNDIWFGLKKDIKVPTFLDYANKKGLTTCSISWPVSAGADYTYNMPMIVPYNYEGYKPEIYLANGNATKNLMDAYFWKYSRFLKGKDRSLDLYTMAIAPDLIRDFGQPDVMLVKMCDLDSARHTYGLYDDNVYLQLKKHDEEFGVLLESIKKYGDYENTNFIIMGDHGQTNIENVLYINKLFEENNLLKIDKDGQLIDFEAFGHSGALSCFIEVKDPNNSQMYNKIKDFLYTLKDDEDIALLYVLDKKEMKEKYHLDGPFDFVIESKKDISFDDRLDVNNIWGLSNPGDHKAGKATHGSRPDRKENTLFIAAGPKIKEGIVLDNRNMVDEGPTLAKILDIEMENVDGVIIEEILK